MLLRDRAHRARCRRSARSTDERARRAQTLLAARPAASARAQRDDGYAGTNVSGKRTSCAPCAAASAAIARELVERRGAVEDDRLDLRAGDVDRLVHSVRRDDLVADGDHAVRDDVRVQSAAVHAVP